MQVYLRDTWGNIGDDYKSNPGQIAVRCKASEKISSGTDSFEWICDARIAASQVVISSAGATADLAEVVIVGFEWGKSTVISAEYISNVVDHQIYNI